MGPDAGAVGLGGVQIADLRLTLDGGRTAVVLTSGPRPTGEVVLLDSLDSEAHSDTAHPGPDANDPVTLPPHNDLDVTDGDVTDGDVTEVPHRGPPG